MIYFFILSSSNDNNACNPSVSDETAPADSSEPDLLFLDLF